ncbi:GNAT family N-acetyltransferase [Micromonospora sp. WMMD734]|uniref:GNAT family N-acetyltransferase n=1 Tax=Micromonospora humidisoli TaxID=2807622 RepID=A0ABS2JDS1_9ACTN|nr:GNAT family N-acetyltransferase [Micromonospora humidisoli]MBM7084696.1 GNAT family N-acetyltransferase [Micromonospora humidisoli]
MSVTLRAAPTVTAPALVLRCWRDDDVDALVEAYRDPELRARTRNPLTTPAQARRWVDGNRQGWAAGRRFSFAVCEPAPDGDLVVGCVLLKDVAPGRADAEIGYWTAGPARGRQVASRAVDAVSRWAFTRFAATGLARLELLHQLDNPASCRVAQKSGFPFVEVLPARPPFPLDGHRHVRHHR